jgi:hypothetical protein
MAHSGRILGDGQTLLGTTGTDWRTISSYRMILNVLTISIDCTLGLVCTLLFCQYAFNPFFFRVFRGKNQFSIVEILMSRLDKDSAVPSEVDVLQTSDQPSAEMQRCLDEVVAVLRKYDLGVTLGLANDRESVLMYRIPEWCAVALSDHGPEVNSEQLWQTDDLENLLFRTYRLANALRQMSEGIQSESVRLEDFVSDLGRHLLDPNRKSH